MSISPLQYMGSLEEKNKTIRQQKKQTEPKKLKPSSKSNRSFSKGILQFLFKFSLIEFCFTLLWIGFAGVCCVIEGQDAGSVGRANVTTN